VAAGRRGGAGARSGVQRHDTGLRDLALLIYRLISRIFIAAIGWVVFFFMFRTEKDIDPDAVMANEETSDPPQFSRSRDAARSRAIGSAQCSPEPAPPLRFSARPR
jgi:hypothetical protein